MAFTVALARRGAALARPAAAKRSTRTVRLFAAPEDAPAPTANGTVFYGGKAYSPEEVSCCIQPGPCCFVLSNSPSQHRARYRGRGFSARNALRAFASTHVSSFPMLANLRFTSLTAAHLLRDFAVEGRC